MKSAPLFKHAAMVGAFVILLYVACLLWRYTITEPAVMQFHLLSLKATFPGFRGFDAGSIALGGVMSFAYGFIGALVFHGLHGNCPCMKK